VGCKKERKENEKKETETFFIALIDFKEFHTNEIKFIDIAHNKRHMFVAHRRNMIKKLVSSLF
jgi:hypothetical protein